MAEIKAKETEIFENKNCPECNSQMDKVKGSKFRCRKCGTTVEVKY